VREKVRIVALSTVATMFLFILAVPAAAGGGGCSQEATNATATGGDEAMVEMVDMCFTPSVLQVEPGSGVTFVNRDVGITHNVGGNGLWGSVEDMHEGDVLTATFDDPGTYPYACSYHVGMTGAIIVGDGMGAGNGETVGLQNFEAPEPVVVTKTVAADGSAGGWITAGALGLLIGAAGGIGLVKVRRAAPAA
jgi:plastocyanin